MVAIQGILLSQKKVMRFLGFQFSNPEPFKWQVYMWINWILLFLVASAEVAYAVAFRGNLAAATSALCPVLYCMNSLPKMFSILLRRNRVYRFLARLDDLTAKATTSGRTILDKSMHTDSRMFVIYAIPSVGVLYLYLIAPLIVDNYNTWKYGNSTWDMPMKSLFPYDVHYSPAYQLTTLSFWISASSGVYYCVALDSLCYGSAINLRGHFQVVQSQIATIQHENRSTNMISKELCQLVRYHMEIVDLCEELNRIASPIMFAQFVTASLQICVVGFQFTIPIDTIFNLLIYIVLLTAVSFQTFIFCHAGTLLTTESLAVADAVYEINWYDLLPKTRLALLLMMLRSQRPVSLETKFFKANLTTFSSIYSSAGSYIALLRQVR